MRPLLLVLPAALGATAVGCQLLTGQECTSIAMPGVGVTIVDSVRAVAVGSGAVVRAYVGATLADSTGIPAGRPELDSLPVSFLVERAGRYTVTVDRAGYHQWRADVTVKSQGCHVVPVPLLARLVANASRSSPVLPNER